MPTYQITTDKGTYQVDTQTSNDAQTNSNVPTNSNPTTSNPTTESSNVSNDLAQASNSLSSMGGGGQDSGTQEAPVESSLSSVLGQFGKGVYTNPIVHPALKALSDWAGFNADQASSALGDPHTVMEQVASGLGSAVPLMAIGGPTSMAIKGLTGALAGATKALPILGKLTSLLNDSQLANSALTGMAYGAAEAKAMQAQGQNVDVGENATNTAGQFLMWSALSKGGASLAGKFISKDLIKQPDLLKNAPLVGQATKKFFTPEGLGSIAGGALAGTLGAPDQKTGIAGAIVGSALSAMNPSEQYQFRQGMGKTMGFKGISSITDHFGKSFAEANDVFENYGFDDVTKAGTRQEQRPNALGGTDTLSTPQIVHETYQNAMQEIGKQKSSLMENALMANENLNPKSMTSFLSLLQQRVNEIQDPTSPVVRQFNRTFESLTNLRMNHAIQTEVERMVTNGIISKPSDVSPLDLYQELPNAMKMQITRQLQSKAAKGDFVPGGYNRITLNGLHQLKMSMQEMVSPQAWAGERAMTPDERVANGISRQISGFIGKSNDLYSQASKQYAQFKEFQGKVYGLDPVKLSQNLFAMDNVKRNIRENELNQISSYLKANGQAKADSRELLQKYYAYDVYNNPATQSFSRSYPVREVSTAALAGLLHLSGLPGGGLVGGLVGWHMSNPAAWLPVLKGASISKAASNGKTVLSNLLKTKSP